MQWTPMTTPVILWLEDAFKHKFYTQRYGWGRMSCVPLRRWSRFGTTIAAVIALSAEPLLFRIYSPLTNF